ncbi:hypothetical protein NGA_2068000, partial [Nannochloropsis gaditana CCMP526]
TLPQPLAEELGSLDGQKVHARLGGQGSRHERLAAARGAVQKDTFGR